MKKLPIALILLACSCTPALIGVSVAFGGATVAVTYEALGADPCCDAGSDAR